MIIKLNFNYDTKKKLAQINPYKKKRVKLKKQIYDHKESIVRISCLFLKSKQYIKLFCFFVFNFLMLISYEKKKVLNKKANNKYSYFC